MRKPVWGVLLLVLACALPYARPALGQEAEDKAPGRALAIQATRAKPEVRSTTADHGKFEALHFDAEKQKTMKPEEVTRTCLGCHNLAALQFHQTIHWTWRDTEGQPENFGKGALSVNNF
ncbi:MAG: hypothetical protein ABIK45_05160 [Pseudomonadota bacterium]